MQRRRPVISCVLDRTAQAMWMLFAILPLFAIGGCGEVKYSGYALAAAAYPVDSLFDFYHSFGDSITAGYELASPSTQVYAALLSTHNSIAWSNFAIAGDQSCDVPTRQIFASAEAPSLRQRELYSLLISTNDIGVKGAGAYEAVFNLCHQASIAWLAVPGEWKVLATSNSVTTTGANHLETSNHWNAITTDERNASVSVPFLRSTAGPVYVWYRIVDGDTGSFQYALDGVVIGQGTTGTVPAIATENGSGNSLALLRLAGVAAGQHVLTMTQTSDGTDGMGFVALGLPTGDAQTGLPRVLVGTTPRMLQGGGGKCATVTTECDAYIADISANVALFQGDGLNVQLFDSRKYELATTTDMIDSLHPNALGDVELFRAIEDTFVAH
jgi:lysophospholipase L1-like esterase